MDEQSLLELMRNWGYYSPSRSHRDSPGYTGLLIAIRQQPTGKHFDPHKLQLRLRDAKGVVKWRTLDWLTPLKASAHACPGRLILRDRFDKSVEFFTFGGSLEVTSGPGEMVYSLHSPAPIFELTDRSETVPDQLAAETESLMGEIEAARWALDEEGFNQRLAEVDPFQFYLASLQSILLHYEHSQGLEQAFPKFLDALHREREWLAGEGLWPVNPPVLEDFLTPD
jgi:hypothetical protein